VRDIAQALLEVLAGRERAAMATVVRAAGSTPQKPGARLLLRQGGTTVGTVGGGAIELVVIEAMREAMRTGEARMIVRDLGYDLAMCCGGRMEVFVEPIEPVTRLIVCGAGHVARATAALARTVGFDLTIVDDREELNNEERFPGCERRLVEAPELLRTATLGEADWVLIATHDHALDEKALGYALAQPSRYVGLVGSERKVLRLVRRVVARRGPIAVDRLYAPGGIDLGALTPEEIAVSIVAELVALRHGKGAVSSHGPHVRHVPHMRIADDARFAGVLQGQATVGNEAEAASVPSPAKAGTAAR
jgi:xanthine dehydrogenase accessory factor